MTRVRPGLVQFGQRALVRGAVPEGEAVPEGAEALLLVTGEGTVGHGLGHALPEPLLQGAVNVLAGGAGAVGNGRQGLSEGGLVEGVAHGGLGGELDHLLVARRVEVTALAVLLAQEARVLVAVAAGCPPDDAGRVRVVAADMVDRFQRPYNSQWQWVASNFRWGWMP